MTPVHAAPRACATHDSQGAPACPLVSRGTALGVAVVTLGLHAGALLRSADAGLALSMGALAVVALVGIGAALRTGPR